MKLLLQAWIRGCDGQSRRSALRHTVGGWHSSSRCLSPSEERDRHCRRRQSQSLASECPSRFTSARFRDEPSWI